MLEEETLYLYSLKGKSYSFTLNMPTIILCAPKSM